ncbi:hypothetical protein EZV62_014674 [Acer yangbiense]|uniref:Wax synthase domain-containing protein n=1 Tax=Acer yangbiense TaxID=1000413 RepID=A0A5C7HST9_9ROSI|nr:hypothetical protein EZV62_014674 [Acer yangbiense]
MLFLHGLSIFSGLYMVWTYRATLVRAMSRYELVQLFNKPYLATSLHDFWGRRWNRYSSNILRQVIYDPTRKALKGIVGYGPAKVVALIASLVVSGVMHELMFHYITCGKKPTWEVTWFFVLQGVCMTIEAGLNNLVWVKGWNPIHPAIRVMCTAGILFAMFYWLLVLPVWRSAENDCGYIIGSPLD